MTAIQEGLLRFAGALLAAVILVVAAAFVLQSYGLDGFSDG